jgi:hypothetical protein
MRSRRITALFVPLLLSIAAFAQDSVVIRFRVVDGNRNRNVDSLDASDFVLLVDGVPQPASSFSAPGSPGPPIEFVFLIGPEHELALRANPAVPGYGKSLQPDYSVSSPLLGAVPDASVAVYGYDYDLRRYCGPTRDPLTFGSAFFGARHVPLAPQSEITRNPSDRYELLAPLPDAVLFTPPSVIPSPGTRIIGPSRGPHVALSWNDALLETLRDSGAVAPSRSRIIIALLGGLPSPDWDPGPVAETCRRLGVILYPSVQMRPWLAREKRAIRDRKRERESPSGPGLAWKKMSRADKLAWLDQEESVVAAYESVGEQTGGRRFPSGGQWGNLAQMFAYDAASLYTIGYTPRNSDRAGTRHRIEVRLRDSSRGLIAGGVGEFVSP